MAVRIYSLAKELKLDSKVLVDLCTRAGVTGKGSALASLTDDEVVKVKAFVASGGKSPAKAPAAKVSVSAPRPVAVSPPIAVSPPAPVEPTTPPRQKVATLPPDEPPPVEAPEPAQPVEPQPTVTPDSPPRVAAEKPPTSPPPLRPDDYISPTATTGRPPVLSSRVAAREGRKSGDGQKGASRPSGPAIRLAAMPTAQQPKSATPAEPAPQKPDIKLPLDAIKATKAGGSKPLGDFVKKAEAKKSAEAKAKLGRGAGKGPAEPAVPSDGVPAKPGDRPKRGKPGDGKLESGMSWREQRQAKRKTTTSTGGGRTQGRSDDDRPRRSTFRRRPARSGVNTAAPRKGNVVIEMPCTVRTFSEAVGVRANQVLGKLLTLGTMSTINSELSADLIELMADELGVEIELKLARNLEDQLLTAIENAEDDPALLESRPPVVTFLGHVDHGKTSLLDRIIGIDVAAGESGGITQHIRAYRIDKDGRSIAFVDTPGHEAFTEMRARGANVTDIAVLVVAADDGVMPQTEEAISHARAAGVPIVVALNKVDLPGVNYDRIYTQLVTSGLQPTEWGGDTELVRCSAHTGEGVDTLLETLLTIAELHDYKANPSRDAYGTCLEAELHEGRGVVAKLMVQNGTMKVGDVVVCGAAHGRVKAMYDTLKPRETHESAGPSTPVNVTGLDIAPAAGDHFYVLEDITQAREIATQRSEQSRFKALGGLSSHVTLETLHERLGGDQVATLNLILRADVRGSIEAIQKELTKLEHPEVQIKVLQATVGGVTEADVYLADASDAIIIGFNVVPDEKARALAEQRGVQIRRYDIIYQVTDDLKASLEGLLKPEQREVELGRALVLRTFSISRLGTIAGCRVIGGTIERNGKARVIRDSRILGEYPLDSLKREKDDAREVRDGLECGIKLSGFNDIKEGDILEVFRVEEVARTL